MDFFAHRTPPPLETLTVAKPLDSKDKAVVLFGKPYEAGEYFESAGNPRTNTTAAAPVTPPKNPALILEDRPLIFKGAKYKNIPFRPTFPSLGQTGAPSTNQMADNNPDAAKDIISLYELVGDYNDPLFESMSIELQIQFAMMRLSQSPDLYKALYDLVIKNGGIEHVEFVDQSREDYDLENGNYKVFKREHDDRLGTPTQEDTALNLAYEAFYKKRSDAYRNITREALSRLMVMNPSGTIAPIYDLTPLDIIAGLTNPAATVPTELATAFDAVIAKAAKITTTTLAATPPKEPTPITIEANLKHKKSTTKTPPPAANHASTTTAAIKQAEVAAAAAAKALVDAAKAAADKAKADALKTSLTATAPDPAVIKQVSVAVSKIAEQAMKDSVINYGGGLTQQNIQPFALSKNGILKQALKADGVEIPQKELLTTNTKTTEQVEADKVEAQKRVLITVGMMTFSSETTINNLTAEEQRLGYKDTTTTKEVTTTSMKVINADGTETTKDLPPPGLRNATFSGLKLEGKVFADGADISGMNFSNCDLTTCDFTGISEEVFNTLRFSKCVGVGEMRIGKGWKIETHALVSKDKIDGKFVICEMTEERAMERMVEPQYMAKDKDSGKRENLLSFKSPAGKGAGVEMAMQRTQPQPNPKKPMGASLERKTALTL